MDESKELELLEDRLESLKREITDIQFQLSIKNAPTDAKYRQWRKKALKALHIKQREFDQVKAELRQRRQSTERQKHTLAELPDLPTPALVDVAYQLVTEMAQRLKAEEVG